MKKPVIKSNRELRIVRGLIRKEMAGPLKRHEEERRRKLLLQLNNTQKAEAKSAKEISRKIAVFRFKHSKAINAAVISRPEFPQLYIDQRLSALRSTPIHSNRANSEHIIDYATPEGRAELGRELAEILGAMQRERTIPEPQIVTCPSTILVGHMHTITGKDLSQCNIRINCSGRISVITHSSSDTAIVFEIPETQGGIPFHAQAVLSVECIPRSRGKSMNVSVTIQPCFNLYTSVDSFSDQDSEVNPFPYRNKIYPTSNLLPELYELLPVVSTHYPDVPGLSVDIHSSEHGILGIGTDGVPDVSILSGPNVTPELQLPNTWDWSRTRLSAEVEITDDASYNFTVHSTFFICVPLGFSAGDWQLSSRIPWDAALVEQFWPR